MKKRYVLSRGTDEVLQRKLWLGAEPIELFYLTPLNTNRIHAIEVPSETLQWIICTAGVVHMDGIQLTQGQQTILPFQSATTGYLINIAPRSAAFVLQTPTTVYRETSTLLYRQTAPIFHQSAYHILSTLPEISTSQTTNAYIIYHLRAFLEQPYIPDNPQDLKLDLSEIQQIIRFEKNPIQYGAAIRSIDQLSKALRIKTYKFRRIIKILFSSTAQQWLLKTKMGQASQLLSKKHLTIEFISKQLQYYSADNFITAFKQYYGLTPHVFRNQTTRFHLSPFCGMNEDPHRLSV